MNHILNEFVRRAETLGIWTSIEANDLKEEDLDGELGVLLGRALGTAAEGCAVSTPLKNRYIKVRSRRAQLQLFIKITFSCEDARLLEIESCMNEMQAQIEKRKGYLSLEMKDDAGIIKLAYPEYTS